MKVDISDYAIGEVWLMECEDEQQRLVVYL